MSAPKTITELNRRFEYQGDGKFDTWEILDQDGKLKGDCDDYASTALYVVEGCSVRKWWKSLITFKAVIWYVRTDNKEGHAMLWHKDYGYIDNITKKWSKKPPFKKVFPYIIPLVAFKMALKKLT